MNRIELKSLAKEQIRGNIGMLFISALVMSLIVSAASAITAGIGTIFIAAPLQIGWILILFGLTEGIKPEVSTIFDGFAIYGKALLLYILTAIYVMLWSLLFFIPGFVKAYSYSMAPYILAENQNMTASEAINESRRIMNGHKMDLFVLELSFIPWFLLGAITFGIAFIYVAPYMDMTKVNFYNKIKNEVRVID